MNFRRIALWGTILILIAAGLAYAFRPQPVPVDLIAAKKAPLVVTINEEGETRVRDVFTMSSPVAGRTQRIELDVGDKVEAQQTVITRIAPIDPEILDVRSQIRAKIAVRAAKAARDYAIAELDSARATMEFAGTELERAKVLNSQKTLSLSALEEASRNFKTRAAAVKVAEAALKMSDYELQKAEAQLISPEEATAKRTDQEVLPIYSPVSGQVLRVFHESEGVVQAGAALVDIGDPEELEIKADLLSSDAVKVQQGQRVVITGWGGEGSLAGIVKRVEPFGFKKVSALGIEEQRVNVIIDFVTNSDQWRRLGHGYQLDVSIVIWESAVVQLPLTALFRKDDRWAVFVEEGGVATARFIEVGQRNDLNAEITGGLKENEQVVSHPGGRVAEGEKIVQRTALN